MPEDRFGGRREVRLPDGRTALEFGSTRAEVKRMAREDAQSAIRELRREGVSGRGVGRNTWTPDAWRKSVEKVTPRLRQSAHFAAADDGANGGYDFKIGAAPYNHYMTHFEEGLKKAAEAHEKKIAEHIAKHGTPSLAPKNAREYVPPHRKNKERHPDGMRRDDHGRFAKK